MEKAIHSLRTLTVTTIASLLFAAGCEAPSSGPQDASNVASSGVRLNADYALLNQCLSPTSSVVAFSDTAMTISGNGNVRGSVVLLGHSTLTLSGNAKVSDRVITPSSNQIMMNGHPTVGNVVVQDLTRNEADVLRFGEDLGSLAATAIYDSIQSSMTLQGNGGLNVIQVNGDIMLSGQNTLTLNGGAHDLFLINVGGDVQVSGQANIKTSSAMSEANVLFRLTGTMRGMPKISITGNGMISGTFFSPLGGAQVSGNGTLQGSIFAASSITISGNGLTINPVPFCPGSFVPAPSPSPSASPSASPSPSDSVTPSPTPSASASPTPSPSPSDSVTPSPTPSATASPIPSPSGSASPAPTCDPTNPFCGGGLLGT